MKIHTVTGDASGNNRSALTKENETYYDIIRKQLQLGRAQMKVPKSNLTHVQSRMIVNSALFRGDVSISSKCKNLLYDVEFCNITPNGTIDKSDIKRGHLLDCFRYLIHLHYTKKFNIQ